MLEPRILPCGWFRFFTVVVRVVSNVFLSFFAGMLLKGDQHSWLQYLIKVTALSKIDLRVKFYILLHTIITVSVRKHAVSSLCVWYVWMCTYQILGYSVGSEKKIIACMMVCVLDRPHVYQADPVRLVDSFLSFFLSFYNDPAYLIDSRHFGDWTSAWPSWMTGDLIKFSRMWLSIQWLLQLTLEKSLFLLTSRGSWSSGQLAGVIL